MRKALFIGSALLITVAVAAPPLVEHFEPKRYEATAEFVVYKDLARIENKGTAHPKTWRSQLELMLYEPTSLQDILLITDLGDSVPPMKNLVPLQKQLRAELRIEENPELKLYTIRYHHSDSTIAKQVVKQALENIIERVVRYGEKSISYKENQIAYYAEAQQKELLAIERELADLNAGYAFPADDTAYQQRIVSAKDRISELRIALEQAEKSRDLYQGELDSLSEQQSAGLKSVSAAQDMYRFQLKNKLIEAENVIAIRRIELEAINDDYRDLRELYPLWVTTKPELEMLNAKRTTIKNTIRNLLKQHAAMQQQARLVRDTTAIDIYTPVRVIDTPVDTIKWGINWTRLNITH